MRSPFTSALLLLLTLLLCLLNAPPVSANPNDDQQAAAGQQDAKDADKGTDQAEASPAQAEDKVEEKPEEKVEEKLETGRLLRRKYHFNEAEKEMEYALYVPKSYDASKPFPLIVALHGLFSNPRQILSYPGFSRHAELHGYILVAPMGYNTRGWYGSRGKGGGFRKDPENLGELSEQDVMNVLALIQKEFKINAQRIYLLGHSMGGGGSMHLAMKYPDIWAAIAPLAPAMPRDRGKLEAAKHIPAIIVQGDNDWLVPAISTRRWIQKMKELEMDHRYIEVKGGDHVSVAFKHFDEIFEFFNARSKAKREAKPSSDNK